jgi:hypothetical protein
MTTALLLLRKFWFAVPIILLGIALAASMANARHWKKRHGVEQAAHAQTRADFTAFANGVREKSEAIIARANERNRRVKAEYRVIEKENDSEIRRRIDAAVAAVRVRTSQAGANPGGGGNQLPRSADAAGRPAGTGGAAVVSAADLEICATAVVKAEGWQAWYSQVRAVER